MGDKVFKKLLENELTGSSTVFFEDSDDDITVILNDTNVSLLEESSTICNHITSPKAFYHV